MICGTALEGSFCGVVQHLAKLFGETKFERELKPINLMIIIIVKWTVFVIDCGKIHNQRDN